MKTRPENKPQPYVTGTCKFYFSDRNGVELENHWLNGVSAGGTGAGVAVDGVDACETRAKLWRDRRGRIARTCISYNIKGYMSEDITIEDFPGHTAVMVKFWCPVKAHRETFWLVGDDARAKIAAAS